MAEIIGFQTVYMLLQGTNGFHQSTFKIGTDAHNLSGCLHLSSQSTFCADKFIKGQTGHFYHTVVQHRLKAGIGLFCNSVLNLIQSIAQSNLCSNLGNRIPSRLRCQCRGTADTGIYFNYTVFKAVGI